MGHVWVMLNVTARRQATLGSALGGQKAAGAPWWGQHEDVTALTWSPLCPTAPCCSLPHSAPQGPRCPQGCAGTAAHGTATPQSHASPAAIGAEVRACAGVPHPGDSCGAEGQRVIILQPHTALPPPQPCPHPQRCRSPRTDSCAPPGSEPMAKIGSRHVPWGWLQCCVPKLVAPASPRHWVRDAAGEPHRACSTRPPAGGQSL